MLAILLTAFALLFARILGALIIFSSLRMYLTHTGLVVLSLAFAGVLFNFEGALAGTSPTGALAFTGAVMLELLLGVLIGLPFAVLVYTFEMTARIVDVSRGAQFGEQLLPGFTDRTSPLEPLAVLLILSVTFSTELYQLPLYLIRESLTLSPPGMGSLGTVSQWLLESTQLIRLSADVIAGALLIAAPVVIVLFVIDLVSSIATRQMGRVNVTFEILPLRLLVGLGVAALVLYAWPHAVPAVVKQAEQTGFEQLERSVQADKQGER